MGRDPGQVARPAAVKRLLAAALLLAGCGAEREPEPHPEAVERITR